MAKESHNFKFDIYLLMITENVFIVILGLQGHKRMGKTCAPNKFCFLRHPTAYNSVRSSSCEITTIVFDVKAGMMSNPVTQ